MQLYRIVLLICCAWRRVHLHEITHNQWSQLGEDWYSEKELREKMDFMDASGHKN